MQRKLKAEPLVRPKPTPRTVVLVTLDNYGKRVESRQTWDDDRLRVKPKGTK